ncbi:thioesterase, partial [bacterium]
MSPEAFAEYLHTSIPITSAMGIEVREVAPALRLAMPLAPNGNHYGSAFGGSLAALLTATAWARATLALE